MKFSSDQVVLRYLILILLLFIGVAFLLGIIPYGGKSDEEVKSEPQPLSNPVRSASPGGLKHNKAEEEAKLRAEEEAKRRIAAFLAGASVEGMTDQEILDRLVAMSKTKEPDFEEMLKIVLAARQAGLLKSHQALVKALGVEMVEKMAFVGLSIDEPIAVLWALDAFGRMKTDHAVPLIAEGLKGTAWSDRVRQMALRALSMINSTTSVALLREIVFDTEQSKKLRRMGILSISENYSKGHESVLDDLHRILDTAEEPMLRKASVRGMAYIRTPQVRKRLTKVLEEDPSSAVRKDAVHLLANEFSQSAEAFDAVRTAIDRDEEPGVRLAAVASIVRFQNPEVIPELVNLATQNMSYAKTAGNTLAKLNPTQALDLMEPLIESGTEEVQLNLIQTFLVIRTDRSREILTRIKNGKHSAAVRLSAAKAVAALNDDS